MFSSWLPPLSFLDQENTDWEATRRWHTTRQELPLYEAPWSPMILPCSCNNYHCWFPKSRHAPFVGRPVCLMPSVQVSWVPRTPLSWLHTHVHLQGVKGGHHHLTRTYPIWGLSQLFLETLNLFLILPCLSINCFHKTPDLTPPADVYWILTTHMTLCQPSESSLALALIYCHACLCFSILPLSKPNASGRTFQTLLPRAHYFITVHTRQKIKASC